MSELAIQAGAEHTAELMAWARSVLDDDIQIQPYGERDILLAIMGRKPLPQPEGEIGIDPIIMRILSAPNIEMAMERGDTANIGQLLAVPLALDKPRWFPSAYAGGALAFCVVEAVERESGLVHALVVGSQQPQVLIWRAYCESALPLHGIFEQSAKPTAAGFYPYNLAAG